MEIVNKKIDEIKEYIKNPRLNKDAINYVAESIKEFGFKNPIILDNNNTIVCGHTRYKACKKLGIKEVPCIIANDLNEEQIKAFRLVDNKVSEYSNWNFDLLNTELEDILDIDMEKFDFLDVDNSINFLDDDKTNEEDEVPSKENARSRTNNNYNLSIYIDDLVHGKYQMPIIENDNFIPQDIIGFNYAKTSKNKNVGIHFYLDDYQFERIWNDPDEYIDILKEYDCIFSPDFSLYIDMPLAMKIWNVYRSRLIGQYMQLNGIKVIPTISWAEKETFEFCFDGIPKGSIVSISTIGIKKNKESLKIWKDGVDEMIKVIEPSAILVYGGKLDYDFGDIEVIYYDNKVTDNLSKIEQHN